MATSTERVLNTAELLEAILLQMDLRTLLLSQRVSKTFQTSIAGSPKLQHKLFFRPTKDVVNRQAINPLFLWKYFFIDSEVVARVMVNHDSVYIDLKDRRSKEGSWRRMYPFNCEGPRGYFLDYEAVCSFRHSKGTVGVRRPMTFGEMIVLVEGVLEQDGFGQ